MREVFGNMVLVISFLFLIYVLASSMALLIVYSAKIVGIWETVCKLILAIFILKYFLNKPNDHSLILR